MEKYQTKRPVNKRMLERSLRRAGTWRAVGASVKLSGGAVSNWFNGVAAPRNGRAWTAYLELERRDRQALAEEGAQIQEALQEPFPLEVQPELPELGSSPAVPTFKTPGEGDPSLVPAGQLTLSDLLLYAAQRAEELERTVADYVATPPQKSNEEMFAMFAAFQEFMKAHRA